VANIIKGSDITQKDMAIMIKDLHFGLCVFIYREIWTTDIYDIFRIRNSFIILTTEYTAKSL